MSHNNHNNRNNSDTLLSGNLNNNNTTGSTVVEFTMSSTSPAIAAAPGGAGAITPISPRSQNTHTTTTSTSQQTRFSFYNADDFKVVVPKKATTPTAPPAALSPDRPQRFQFYPTSNHSHNNSGAAVGGAATTTTTEEGGMWIPSIIAPDATERNADTNKTVTADAVVDDDEDHHQLHETLNRVVELKKTSKQQNHKKKQHQHPQIHLQPPTPPIQNDDRLMSIMNHPTISSAAPTTTDTVAVADSVEILKSLQEHEQQRLEILAGPKQRPTTTTTAVGSMDATAPRDTTQNTTTTTATHAAFISNNNPYEDAIKEALQLLRRHRTTTSSVSGGPSRSHSSSIDNNNNNFDERGPSLPQQQQQQHPQFQEITHAQHTPVGNILSSTIVPHPLSTSTLNVTGGELGDAYQIEIEARRKQRQERMARYASRLAELQQEDDDGGGGGGGPPVVDTSRSLDDDASFDHPNNDSNLNIATYNRYSTSSTEVRGIARGSAHQQHPWDSNNHTPPPSQQHRRKWMDHNEHNNNNDEDDAVVMSRSADPEISSTIVPAISNLGSMSTLSNTHRPDDDDGNTDDEVQRGVERVLLAILERANNSRGRSTNSSTRSHTMMMDSNGYHYTTTGGAELLGNTSRIHGGGAGMIQLSGTDEEKKSNPEDHFVVSQPAPQDDALLRAMAELLGPPRSISNLVPSPPPPSSIPGDIAGKTTIENDSDPSCSLATQDENSAREVDPTTVLLSGRNKDDVMLHGDRVVGDPIVGPVGKMHNRNISSDDDDDDDINATDTGSLVSSGDVNSSSNIDDDDDDKDTLEDALAANEDDDDDDDDEDEDSGIYEDDGSSGDEYDSDEVNARRKGVLGPLSKRSGGTTGVVLEDDSSSSCSSSYDDDDDDGHERSNRKGTKGATSILQSLTAAVSRVAGIASLDDRKLSPSSTSGLPRDKYTLDEAKSNDVSDIDAEANDLMLSLCAHLLRGIGPSDQLLETVPEWDESNPDEAGYRIVRLSRPQLRRVQIEYERTFGHMRQSESKSKVRSKAADEDDTYENDLLASEDLLKQAEKATGNAVDSSSELRHSENDEHNCLPGFMGVKPAGKGEMGDLEYFTLPIIFKSHVTGFEPTKDLLLEPGNVLAGQYLVEGILGSAAFSTAYKCVDLNSPEDSNGCQDLVCLKIIKNTKDFFDQSLDEIKILELLRQTGRCDENFIVEMKSFFYHREHLVIVTELLRQNLFEFGKFILDSGEEPYFTITRLSYITRQCLIALKFVHEMGLVHSDVKPENILLASYSRAQVKLIDFGSSCYLTDRQSSYIQSRSYRAPEVVLGLPYDGRIDIWSLGCVVAEMFTGEVTFQNDSIVSMMSRIEAICGPFPRHMVTSGRQSSRFFTSCGLLYEKVPQGTGDSHDSYSGGESSNDDDDKQKPTLIDVFQPKRTTLAARLGFASDLMDKFDTKPEALSREERRHALFCDLVRKLLTIDPDLRLTAAEALEHPAMLHAATLTETDVKYPSS